MPAAAPGGLGYASGRVLFAVWCVHCHRVWDGTALKGARPHLECPDGACNGVQPGAFIPYAWTRHLIAPHWPREPVAEQRLDLRPQRPREGAPVSLGDRA